MRVLITRPIPKIAAETLKRAGHEVMVLPHDRPCTREELIAGSEQADALITMVTDKIDAEFLGARPGIKAIANFGVGYNNIDVDACTTRQVRVSNTPDVLTDATAEVAWTLLLMAARRAGEGERVVRAGKWAGWGPMQYQGMAVVGKTLGIIGAGRIGVRVAQMSRGFKMKVIYSDRGFKDQMDAMGASLEPLSDLLQQSDFVSLHVPLTDDTHHLIGARELAMMKSTAVLINTCRGPVVDEAALAEALRRRRIFAAGMDVYEEEPKIHHGLMNLENVVLLPHIGSATVEARERMALLAAENLVEMLRGEKGRTQVNELAS